MQGEKSPDPQRASLKLLTDLNIVKIGYARGTNKEPSLKEQLAYLKRIGCKTVYTDPDTHGQRHQLDQMLTSVGKGDTVYVQQLHRLGRTSSEMMDSINQLIERQVYVVCLEESIDTRTQEGCEKIKLLNSMVQRDRQAFLERTQAGVEAARKEGRNPGRKKTGLAQQHREIAKPLYTMYKSGDFSVKEVLKMFSIKSRSTFYRILQYWEQEEKKIKS